MSVRLPVITLKAILNQSGLSVEIFSNSACHPLFQILAMMAIPARFMARMRMIPIIFLVPLPRGAPSRPDPSPCPVHRYLPLSFFRLEAVLPAGQAPKAALSCAAVGQPLLSPHSARPAGAPLTRSVQLCRTGMLRPSRRGCRRCSGCSAPWSDVHLHPAPGQVQLLDARPQEDQGNAKGLQPGRILICRVAALPFSRERPCRDRR